MLKGAVLHTVGVKDIPGVITWLYAPSTGKKEVAALAPLLLPALQAKDKAAVQIAEKAARELAEMVAALWKRAGLTQGELVFSGSVLKHYSVIADKLTKHLSGSCPRLKVV